jgi:hypothetical protein
MGNGNYARWIMVMPFYVAQQKVMNESRAELRAISRNMLTFLVAPKRKIQQ